MKNARLDALIWLLIFGGLLVMGLGLFVMSRAAGFGILLETAGAAFVLTGAVLIWVRSRRPPD